MHVFTHVRGGCDNHRCHDKKPRKEVGLGCERRHARKWWAGILGDFEKKQLVEIWSWTRRVQFGSTGCAARCWVRWNSQHSKNCVSLSSCWKPKSQEGNKSFVPELPRVVSVSGFLCIWTFYISVYFTHSYLAMLHKVSTHQIYFIEKLFS